MPRAPGQHVGHIDRRRALLRTAILRVIEQCKEESLDIKFSHILSESVFGGNALVSVNNTSPYNAVYGRVPRLLPNLELDDMESTDAAWQVERIREISVQQMVEGTARVRTDRALRTRTLPAGEREEYKIGEQVDFYRPPASKDISGWIGPAKIIDISNISRGTITVRHRTEMPIEVRLQDLRRHLAFLVFLGAPHAPCTLVGSGWELIVRTIEHLARGRSIYLG